MQSKRMYVVCIGLLLKDRPVLEKVAQFKHFIFLIWFSLVFWYQKISIRCEFTGYLFHDVLEKRQQVRWDTIMGLAMWVNGSSQWDWEENGNKTWLSLGTGMGMNEPLWTEVIGIEKYIPAHL